jgi:hypothetical protein
VQELRHAAERLRRAQEYLDRQIGARLAAVRWLTRTDESDEHRS